MGHNLIAYIHDPENRHLEDYGVMADVATAMRDPIFYRWHSFIDSIFVKLKNQLQPYQTDDLQFDGINVEAISVRITARISNVTPNILVTYWQKSDVDLGAGLDFGPGNVYAQVRILSAFKRNKINKYEFHTRSIEKLKKKNSWKMLFIFSLLICNMHHSNIK